MTTLVPHLLFDGSWKGLLTCVFEVFDRRWFGAKVFIEEDYQPTMFENCFVVLTDNEKASRVYQGLRKKLKSRFNEFLYAFFSESADCHQHLLDMAVYIFNHKQQVADNFGHPAVMAVSQFAKSVGREAHRMKAFIRFQKLSDGTYFEVINPDFNVLPLVVKHFSNRYADQAWIIYDEKRDYGMFYNKLVVQEISFAFWTTKKEANAIAIEQFDQQEMKFDQLWKDYYKSTNIASRKNEKLHRQLVPLRYRRYLNEFVL